MNQPIMYCTFRRKECWRYSCFKGGPRIAFLHFYSNDLCSLSLSVSHCISTIETIFFYDLASFESADHTLISRELTIRLINKTAFVCLRLRSYAANEARSISGRIFWQRTGSHLRMYPTLPLSPFKSHLSFCSFCVGGDERGLILNQHCFLGTFSPRFANRGAISVVFVLLCPCFPLCLYNVSWFRIRSIKEGGEEEMEKERQLSYRVTTTPTWIKAPFLQNKGK